MSNDYTVHELVLYSSSAPSESSAARSRLPFAFAFAFRAALLGLPTPATTPVGLGLSTSELGVCRWPELGCGRPRAWATQERSGCETPGDTRADPAAWPAHTPDAIASTPTRRLTPAAAAPLNRLRRGDFSTFVFERCRMRGDKLESVLQSC